MSGRSLLTRRRDRAVQLQNEIAKLEGDLAGDEQAAAQSRSLAGGRETQLEELAAKEAAGTLTPGEVDGRLEAIERESAAHQRNAEARERAIALRRRDLDERRAELIQLEAAGAFESQLDQVKRFARDRRAVERALADAIDELASTVEAAETSLQAEEEAREMLEELRPDGETRTVDPEDGPTWPDVDELVAFLTAGPRLPIATAEASRERTRRAAAARQNEAIVSIIRQYGSRSPTYYEHIARYPEEFQKACNEAFARAEARGQRHRASGSSIHYGEDGFPVDGKFARV
jgi:hypothetical protein